MCAYGHMLSYKFIEMQIKEMINPIGDSKYCIWYMWNTLENPYNILWLENSKNSGRPLISFFFMILLRVREALVSMDKVQRSPVTVLLLQQNDSSLSMTRDETMDFASFISDPFT